jgi:flagellar protein FlaI
MDEKRQAFLRCVDEICVVHGSNGGNGSRNNGNGQRKNGNGNGRTGLGLLERTFGSKIKQLEVTPRQLMEIKYLIVRDKVGLGVLDPIVYDKYVEDVSCSGMGVIFLEHKVFKSLKTVVNFPTNEDLDQFVMRLAERIKKPVSVHSPIVDATLPDGSRINIVYGDP